jgi:hypothetical protein
LFFGESGEFSFIFSIGPFHFGRADWGVLPPPDLLESLVLARICAVNLDLPTPYRTKSLKTKSFSLAFVEPRMPPSFPSSVD